MEAVYFIFCCFRRLSYELLDFCLFLFSSFSSYIELPRPWKVDQELKMEKKKSSVQGHIFHVVLFFLLPRFFLSCRVLVIHDRTVKDPR